MANIMAPGTTVFMLQEAAEILGMPKSRVKNWTIGRPLRILPSVQAHGTGSRNLYGRRDLYSIAIANRLSLDGLTVQAIQNVLDGLGPDLTEVFAVVVAGRDLPGERKRRRTGTTGRDHGQLIVHAVDHSQDMQRVWESLRALISNSLGCYVLHIGQTIRMVDEQVRRFRLRARGHRPRKD